MKTVRTVICMLLLLTVAGLTVTLITKGVLEGKRRILYGYDTTVDMSEPTTDGIHNSDDGPGNMIMDRETYLEELASLEKQINEIWANVADVNGNSALSAA
ncbi:MAG: hypothetical protein IJW18_06295, partial [Lachnospiraceae bacterium]|nr:hypothetical protein [Lachnospiraceae bacterium]